MEQPIREQGRRPIPCTVVGGPCELDGRGATDPESPQARNPHGPIGSSEVHGVSGGVDNLEGPVPPGSSSLDFNLTLQSRRRFSRKPLSPTGKEQRTEQ